MIEITFQEELIKYEDDFLHFKDQPSTAQNVQKLTIYAVLYSESLMDEAQASYIDLRSRIQQLRENAEVLKTCRIQLSFEYGLGGSAIDAIDQTIASIEKFVQENLVCE